MQQPHTVVPSRERAIRPAKVRVRDIVRHGKYELTGTERALRVPYDMFHPKGVVEVRGELASYIEGDEVRIGRTARCLLGETRPGERVLVRLDATSLGLEDDGDWWLCEVEAKDGVEGE
jgi:hypothetical protein